MKLKKYRPLKEVTYSVTNVGDAKDAISDIITFLITKYPEPKSLWLVASSIVGSLETSFPDPSDFRQMKNKLLQIIKNS